MESKQCCRCNYESTPHQNKMIVSYRREKVEVWKREDCTDTNRSETVWQWHPTRFGSIVYHFNKWRSTKYCHRFLHLQSSFVKLVCGAKTSGSDSRPVYEMNSKVLQRTVSKNITESLLKGITKWTGLSEVRHQKKSNDNLQWLSPKSR